jgi:hypothetical protein
MFSILSHKENPKIKMTLRFHPTTVRWLSSRKQTAEAGENAGEKEPLYTVGKNVNYHSDYENQYGGSPKN